MERFASDGNIKVLASNEHGFVAEIINRDVKELEVVEEVDEVEDVVENVTENQ